MRIALPRRMPRTAAAAALAAGLIAASPLRAEEPAVAREELPRVVRSIEELNELRERLARSFLGEGDAEPDAQTFAQVCKPVGERARALSREEPWTVRQMAVRYRNPAHAADEQARRVHELMEERPELQGLWMRDRRDGRRDGLRYFRRITVREACLACHGAKEERPAFVRERYPEDRAFGFEVGELRGVYSVFLPDDAAAEGAGD